MDRRKRFTVLAFLVLCLAAGLWADGLNAKARLIREKIPAAYAAIKTRAEGKWEEEYDMVLYEINKQCEAFYTFLSLADSHFKISMMALAKWMDGGEAAFLALDSHSAENVFILPVDWSMAVYEAQKQIAAKNNY